MFKMISKVSLNPYRSTQAHVWSLTPREEQRLRVTENRVLRRILGPQREEVAGDWRRFHNEELRNSYASPNVIRVIKSRRMR
jgi:hypothetical protein